MLFLSVCIGNGWLGGSRGALYGDALLSKQRKRKIREEIEKRRERIQELITDVVISRIDDGMVKFSATTEEAEAALHEELVLAKMEMSPEEQKSDAVVEALMTHLMLHPYDLRGRRHLLTVLELYKMEEYSTGFLKRIKRKTYGFCLCFCCGVTCILSCTGLSPLFASTRNTDNTDTADPDMSSTHPPPTHQPNLFAKIKTFFFSIFVPCGLIMLDMGYSDTNVMYALFSYGGTLYDTRTATAEVFTDVGINTYYMRDMLTGMLLLLILLYCFSALSLLFTPFFSSLLTSYRTALAMGNTEDEKAGTATPMGTVTRYNTALDESSTEASFQGCLQWATYLTIQLVLATRTGSKEDSSFKFSALVFSGLLSTLSLTMGQLKGSKITAEYLMTGPQQAVYFLAALASTISGQLQLTLLVVTWTDLGVGVDWLVGGEAGAFIGGLFTLIGLLVLIPALSLLRNKMVGTQLHGEGILTQAKGSMMSLFSVQPLHLPTSKGRVVTWSKTYYPTSQCQQLLYKENLVANLTISFISLSSFVISHVLVFLATSSTKMIFLYSSTLSMARFNFLLTATIGIPLCWLLSNLLIKVFFHLDLGALQCTPTFRFCSQEESTGCCARWCGCCTGCCGCCSGCCWCAKPEFVSEEGRWIVDDDNDESDEEETGV